MPNDELRTQLVQRIDALLARTLMVWGQDRTLLTAVRSYVGTMTDEQLSDLQKFIPKTQEEP